MGGNYERWNWDAIGWKCARCGAGPAAAKHQGKRGEESHPYNARQTYCSVACAKGAKAQLQQKRRAEEQAERQAAWRCATCTQPAVGFIPGKRVTCSERCAALRRADLQQDRRWEKRAEAVTQRMVHSKRR